MEARRVRSWQMTAFTAQPLGRLTHEFASKKWRRNGVRRQIRGANSCLCLQLLPAYGCSRTKVLTAASISSRTFLTRSMISSSVPEKAEGSSKGQ